MLLFVLLFLASIIIEARPFGITQLTVPDDVLPGQEEVEMECRYEDEFTELKWYKDNYEFYRYERTGSKHIHYFQGVDNIEDTCGPTVCHLKLANLTKAATGYYRCAIEKAYGFSTKGAHMEVHRYVFTKPLLEGLDEEYGEGEEIKAFCRGAPDTELRWYINNKELKDLRGSAVLRKNSSRMLFSGTPPVVTIQCGEFKFGRMYGFNQENVRWKEERNKSYILKVHSMFLGILSLHLLRF